jgi:hypothetical protein
MLFDRLKKLFFENMDNPNLTEKQKERIKELQEIDREVRKMAEPHLKEMDEIMKISGDSGVFTVGNAWVVRRYKRARSGSHLVK